jgi:hypothetical protein
MDNNIVTTLLYAVREFFNNLVDLALASMFDNISRLVVRDGNKYDAERDLRSYFAHTSPLVTLPIGAPQILPNGEMMYYYRAKNTFPCLP